MVYAAKDEMYKGQWAVVEEGEIVGVDGTCPLQYKKGVSVRSGRGSYYYKHGDEFTGEWRDHERVDGADGTLLYANGDSYVGQFKNFGVDALYHGKGKLTTKLGEQYEGQWRGGKKHGQGAVVFEVCDRNGRFRSYEGAWDEDTPHGYGSMTYDNDDCYSGQWNQGVIVEGEGVIVSAYERGLATLRPPVGADGAWLDTQRFDDDGQPLAVAHGTMHDMDSGDRYEVRRLSFSPSLFANCCLPSTLSALNSVCPQLTLTTPYSRDNGITIFPTAKAPRRASGPATSWRANG
jgi:hypothetical protein